MVTITDSPTRSVRTQCNLDYLKAKGQLNTALSSALIEQSDGSAPLMEGQRIVITEGDGEEVQSFTLAQIGSSLYAVEDEPGNTSESEPPGGTTQTTGDILNQAQSILMSSPVYRTFSYKVYRSLSIFNYYRYCIQIPQSAYKINTALTLLHSYKNNNLHDLCYLNR